MALPPGTMGLDAMLAALRGEGLSGPAAMPIQRPIVPGVAPQKGQGSSDPALNAMQILAIMKQPKLGLK